MHFGVLDLRGALGRWFGGIGATAPGLSLLVSADHDRLDVSGEDRSRGRLRAQGLDRFGVAGGARLRVHRMFPSHAGLGSGTQLALAVGRALSDLHGLGADAPAIASATGRARRSAVGTWTFDGGGLVVEGGRASRDNGDERVAPLLARVPFPSGWHCVVGVPHAEASVSGSAETAALASLPPPPHDEVQRVAHPTLMALLPALAEADLTTFGRALSEIQAITGSWFAPIQGGVFAPGWTDYHKRVQYVSYDVTPLLHRGDNAIGAILGDGWFASSGSWSMTRRTVLSPIAPAATAVPQRGRPGLAALTRKKPRTVTDRWRNRFAGCRRDGAWRRRVGVEFVDEGGAATQDHPLVQRSLDGNLERSERRRFFQHQRARDEGRAARVLARQRLERTSHRVGDARMRDEFGERNAVVRAGDFSAEGGHSAR